MSNRLTPTRVGGGNREEKQIQTININNRKDNNNNNNTFNVLQINHILLSYHTVISLVVVPVVLLCHYSYL